MRDLTNDEITIINGGLTPPETIIGATVIGGLVGALKGAAAAPLFMEPSGVVALIVKYYGAALGLAIGLGIGCTIVGAEMLWDSYY